jgi:hypothetical protein
VKLDETGWGGQITFSESPPGVCFTPIADPKSKRQSLFLMFHALSRTALPHFGRAL